jgi:hypothetical protein
MKTFSKLLASLVALYAVYFVTVFSFHVAKYELSGASARDTARLVERQQIRLAEGK